MEIPTPMKAPTGAITSKLSSIQSSINIFFPLSVSTPCAYKIILNYKTRIVKSIVFYIYECVA